MQIYWHGYSSIRIEATMNQTDVSLVTDPFESEGSVKFPKSLSPDMAVLSHQDRSRFALDALQGAPFIVSDPGEYEAKGLFVYGIQDKAADAGTEQRPLIYRMVIEGVSIAFLGQLKRKPTDFEVESLEAVDILILPVGGGEGMDAETATQTVKLIEPRMVIPINFDTPGIKASLTGVDAFCTAMGAFTKQEHAKLKIAKKDLPSEDLVVAILERS